MALTLGKRKRKAAEASVAPTPAQTEPQTPPQEADDPKHAAEEEEDVQAIFKRHFEARFRPLASSKKTRQRPSTFESPPSELDDSPSLKSADSDWSGISSDGEAPPRAVEVIEHTSAAMSSRGGAAADKRALKQFMSSHPPPTSSITPSTGTRTTTASPASAAAPTDPTETAHLKNDLALQRLLSESHLLSGAPSSAATLAPTGKTRHLAMELRALALGARGGATLRSGGRMPLAHRRGIDEKARRREERRRREAREGGVVLEMPTAVAGGKGKGGDKRRERGVGGASVGRFKGGGTLVLSRRDLASIKGGGGGGGGRGMKRRM